MKISEKLKSPIFSFEFFPPKNEAGFQNLFQTIENLKYLNYSIQNNGKLIDDKFDTNYCNNIETLDCSFEKSFHLIFLMLLLLFLSETNKIKYLRNYQHDK